MNRLLIANRGEIAVRIINATNRLGIESCLPFPSDEPCSLAATMATHTVAVTSRPGMYLDAEQLAQLAITHQCDALHPGYGFLSESPELAEQCHQHGLCFVGPSPETLRLLGNKHAARGFATSLGIPVLPGSPVCESAEQAVAFAEQLPAHQPLLLKPVQGGGGKGMRLVTHRQSLPQAFHQASSEARRAFADGRLYVERMLPRCRHIEVQLLGDGRDVIHLHERECSLQLGHQKVIEFSPAPGVRHALRERMLTDALKLGRALALKSLCTIEFLLDVETGEYFFIEANPRVQVEHTVTEIVTGIDLVQAQLRVSRGETLADLGLTLDSPPQMIGHACQIRVAAERWDMHGRWPQPGTLDEFQLPEGPGIRVDTGLREGDAISSRYDSLLGKIIVHHPDSNPEALWQRAAAALAETRIAGVATPLPWLRQLVCQPELATGAIHTRWLEDFVAQHIDAPQAAADDADMTGANKQCPSQPSMQSPSETLHAPLAGVVVALAVTVGDKVVPGQTLMTVEAMKMHHDLTAAGHMKITCVLCQPGQTVKSDQPLLHMQRVSADATTAIASSAAAPQEPSPALHDVWERYRQGQDERRPEAVQRRHRQGKRTARENISALCDPGSFHEYGAFVHAAQSYRYELDTLQQLSPADGLISGIGTINSDSINAGGTGVGDPRCVVLAYDYTVFAGTQGANSQKKMARMLQLAEQQGYPVVLYAEGGGGRPGDLDDRTRATGLNMSTFRQYARLRGKVPRLAIVSGRCFAGNALLAGSSDLIIATRDANLGMAGPAMIEAAGQPACAPEDIGPVRLHAEHGLIDLLVDNEAEATAQARKMLGYLQGPLLAAEPPDQTALRHVIPLDRRKAYDMEDVARLLADEGSFSILQGHHAANIMTALCRIQGQPVALLGNNPRHLSGAIDAPAARKAARFLRFCNQWQLPVVSLTDTPGFLVGLQAEQSGQVQAACMMFDAAANMQVPFISVITRKAYGLGAMAMTAASFHGPQCTLSWPGGEFGGMSFEGAVRLAHRDELEQCPDGPERQARFDELVREYATRGSALSVAASFEFDAVIDPAETRSWITMLLQNISSSTPRTP